MQVNDEILNIHEKELQRIIEDSLKKWTDHTTIHGFSNIKNSKSWVSRTVWIILVLSCMIYCFYCKMH